MSPKGARLAQVRMGYNIEVFRERQDFYPDRFLAIFPNLGHRCKSSTLKSM